MTDIYFSGARGGGKEAVREAATAQGAVRNGGEEAACRAPVLGARARRRSLHAKMRVSSTTLVAIFVSPVD
jgi:hypothetical protein